MRGSRRIHQAVAVAFASVMLGGLTPAMAQTAPGPANNGRDCQTVRTCNFTRGAEVRGCLSSYTCRTCRMVPATCIAGAAQGACQKFRCSWGG